MRQQGCALCEGAGGRVVFQGASLRLVHVEEAGVPAFYRVVWTAHAAEFSDLARAQRDACMEAVVAVEETLRSHLRPAKVNLASLGNMVAHLHWHVIARFAWDSRFPDAVWAAARRESPAAEVAAVQARLPAMEAALAARLQALDA